MCHKTCVYTNSDGVRSTMNLPITWSLFIWIGLFRRIQRDLCTWFSWSGRHVQWHDACESCHTSEGVLLHMWRSLWDVTRVNESCDTVNKSFHTCKPCHTCRGVILHIWRSPRDVTRVNESCHTVNESFHTCEGVISNMEMSHLIHAKVFRRWRVWLKSAYNPFGVNFCAT